MTEASQAQTTIADRPPRDKAPQVVGGYEIHLAGEGRQFKSDFLEQFGRTHPLIPLAVYVPAILACWLLAASSTAATAASIALWTVAGLAFWTFAEYWLHRFLFHWQRFPKLHYFIHGIHHVYPNDLNRVVMPPGASLSMAAPLFLVAYYGLGEATGLPFFAGFAGGYLWYDMTHYWTHVAKPRSTWGKLLRRQHMLHHFKTPDQRFGVSTPLWDLVFGTYGEFKKGGDAEAG
jgi:sterol desaturase/sphingolipid hydroxylase (fatty acid hydroxylase superfamily)